MVGALQGPLKVPATAASHHSAAVAAADNKGGLEDGRQHDDTIRFINHALRNVVRNVHDLGNYSSRGLYSILFLILSKNGQNHQAHQA